MLMIQEKPTWARDSLTQDHHDEEFSVENVPDQRFVPRLHADHSRDDVYDRDCLRDRVKKKDTKEKVKSKGKVPTRSGSTCR